MSETNTEVIDVADFFYKDLDLQPINIPPSTSAIWQKASDIAEVCCNAAQRQHISVNDFANRLSNLAPQHMDIDDWSDAELALTHALATRWEKHQVVAHG